MWTVDKPEAFLSAAIRAIYWIVILLNMVKNKKTLLLMRRNSSSPANKSRLRPATQTEYRKLNARASSGTIEPKSALPDAVVMSGSMNQFEARLGRWWTNDPTLYQNIRSPQVTKHSVIAIYNAREGHQPGGTALQ